MLHFEVGETTSGVIPGQVALKTLKKVGDIHDGEGNDGERMDKDV